MKKKFDKEEIETLTTIVKSVWFFVVTAGVAIKHGVSTASAEKTSGEVADSIAKELKGK